MKNDNIHLEHVCANFRNYIFASDYLICRRKPFFKNTDPCSFVSYLSPQGFHRSSQLGLRVTTGA